MTQEEIQAINILFGQAVSTFPAEQRLQVANQAAGLLEKISKLISPTETNKVE